jgi:hypothetical protein
MAIDAEYIYNSLLGYNYFPAVKEYRDELPSVFSTYSFDSKIADDLLDGGFNGRNYDYIGYRTTRHTNVTRMMHIPHPLPYARLCKCIYDNWARLEHICVSENSRIIPKKRGDEVNDRRVIVYDYEDEEEDKSVDDSGVDRIFVADRDDFEQDVSMHFRLSCGARFLVDADVASCFNTIYTHAIAWALVGHDKAKANKNNRELWYNKLDISQRDLKRGETQGIPIGPGTSNIISEVILQKIDDVLLAKDYRFTRCIDDYKCFCEDHNEAETFIHDLEKELTRYLLSLNIKKVAINKMPIPYRDGWVIDLNTHFPQEEILSANKVVNYLDYAIELQKNHVDGSVIKYALRSLASKIDETNINEFLSYALNLSYHYPVILPIICEVVNKNKISIKKRVIKELLSVNFRQHLKYKRSDAICWCLYCAGLINLDIGKKTAENIIYSCDCMSIAMLLSFGKHIDLVLEFVNGLADKPTYDKDQYWILIQELGSQIKNQELKKYYNETGLKFLADNNVYFIYDINPTDDF